MCNQLKKDLNAAWKAKAWQAYSTTSDRYEAECVNMLYYRENFADDQIKACPNRGMPASGSQ